MFPLEAFENTLLKAARVLESLSTRFHLTGGITSVVYGEPRLTQDLDLVIDNAAVAAQLEQQGQPQESPRSATDLSVFLGNREGVGL